jgi:hypothetical protein
MATGMLPAGRIAGAAVNLLIERAQLIVDGTANTWRRVGWREPARELAP